jgi:hypothetical protein
VIFNSLVISSPYIFLLTNEKPLHVSFLFYEQHSSSTGHFRVDRV